MVGTQPPHAPSAESSVQGAGLGAWETGALSARGGEPLWETHAGGEEMWAEWGLGRR